MRKLYPCPMPLEINPDISHYSPKDLISGFTQPHPDIAFEASKISSNTYEYTNSQESFQVPVRTKKEKYTRINADFSIKSYY
ncbi:MAG: hypothetical protein JW874_01025, partial [Spirochaetales bacterium]|nr:hypothetical protein [Spirochaetales bacterium]